MQLIRLETVNSLSSEKGIHHNTKGYRRRGYRLCVWMETEIANLVLAYKNWTLTHLSVTLFLWDIDKHCRSRSDAAECGIWCGSPLFAYRMCYQNLNKDEKYHPTSLKMEMYGPTDKNGIFHLA